MKRSLAVLTAAILLFGACTDDGGNQDSVGTTDDTGSTTTIASGPTTTSSAEDNIAMWPATDVTFKTPEEAAKDFVSKVLDVPPTLGTFQQGDNRSGEIDVFSPGEGGGTKVKRATLLLRQLGPGNGWFVLAAGSTGVTITNLSTADTIKPGKVIVQGQGRGFEGTLVVSGYVRGDDVELGKVVTQGGSMAETAPYSATLDLGGAQPGSTIFVVVRAGTGLETDPGEFAAVPLLVS